MEEEERLEALTTKNVRLITSWHYANNWVYVDLSRAQSLAGLFLQKKLDRTQHLRPNENKSKNAPTNEDQTISTLLYFNWGFTRYGLD
jgi:hypothetical protein